MKQIFIILLFSVLIVSCKEQVLDLDDKSLERYTFLELPSEVKILLKKNINYIINSRTDTYFTTDSLVNFTYGRSGVADGWFSGINSNYHHFFIDSKHCRMKGNKGDPFILHKNIIFFCELNLHEDSFKESTYFSVKINPHL